MLNIHDLHVAIDGAPILRGLTLSVGPGEVHALMGPNGAGKSTLAKVLAGHPSYEVTAGSVMLNGNDLLDLDPEERAQMGLFMGFQYPIEVPGVTNFQFLHAAYDAVRKVKTTDGEFGRILDEKISLLGIKAEFKDRGLNEGFSGGEKKRNEILQMALLEPSMAILDETDSGLDIDAMKVVAEGIEAFRRPDRSILLITHYQRLLDYVRPDVVHVVVEGKIVVSGGPELALKLEEQGYDWVAATV
jgi:Fe-S cluster assembly ATP-binding protein